MPLLCGCAKKDLFRNSTKDTYNLSMDEQRLVQYYITTDVTFKRTEIKKEMGVTSANILKAEESIFRKEILIDKSTEGAAYKVYPNKLTIAFDKDMFLDFEPNDMNPNTPYSLKRFNGTDIKKSGDTVSYQGKTYSVNFITIPMLNYKFTNDLEEKKEREKVKGMTVQDMMLLEQENVLKEKRKSQKDTLSVQKENLPTNRKEYALHERKEYRFRFLSGQVINGYLIAESDEYYFISSEKQPQKLLGKLLKSQIESKE